MRQFLCVVLACITSFSQTYIGGNYQGNTIVTQVQQVPTPTIAPSAGTYTGPLTVTITDTDGLSTIHYTTDGSAATCLSTVYTASFTITSGSEIVNAVACRALFVTSATALNAFIVNVSSGGPIANGFVGYTGSNITQWPTVVPNVGGASKITGTFTDTSYSGLPGVTTLPLYWRCTDRNSAPDQATKNAFYAGIGGSGALPLFNHDNTVMHVVMGGGGDGMILVDPINHACAPSVITADKNQTNPGSSLVHADLGGGFFSLSNKNLWHSFGGGATDGYTSLQIIKYNYTNLTFPTGGQYTVGPIEADFQYGYPNAANTVAWANNTLYHYGDYVKVALTVPDWSASTSSFLIGDIIVPTVGNSTGDAYKLVQVGTTASTHPTWHTTQNVNSIVDGTAKWQDLGGPAVFLFQLIAPGTTCTAQASGMPGFAGSDGHPDFYSTVIDNTCTWINMGSLVGSPSWVAAGGVSVDEQRFAQAASTNTYGNFTDGWASGNNGNDGVMTAGSQILTSATTAFTAAMVGKQAYVRGAGISGKMLATTIAVYTSKTQVTLAAAASTSVTNAQVQVNAGLNYTKYTGIQGTGFWNMYYNAATNIYYVWNAATGIESAYTCTGGTGYNCSGGSFVRTTRGHNNNNGCLGLNIHNLKMATVCHQSVITQQGNDLNMNSNACPKFTIWNPDSVTFDQVNDVQDAGSLNHWTTRACDVIGLNAFGTPTADGVYMASISLITPSAAPKILWQLQPCSTTVDPITHKWVPGSCALGNTIDNHLSAASNPPWALDAWPSCGDTYNYDNASPNATSPYQGEVTCTQTATTWTNPLTPSALRAVYRGPHHFNTQTHDNFNARFVISQYSQCDAGACFVGFTSDYNSQLGSIDGTTPTLGTTPAGSINTGVSCYGGWNWQADTNYTVGTLIHASTDLTGGGSLFGVWQVTQGGKSQSTANLITLIPTLFPSVSAVGTVVNDNTVKWIKVALVGNCAADVFIAQVSLPSGDTLTPGNSLTYTSQTVGTTSASQTITVTNSGTAALYVTALTFGGANPTNFATTSGCVAASPIAPGGTCTIPVTFTPSATGARTATITLVDNATNTSKVITLSGTGV
jgi:hypothetical protein